MDTREALVQLPSYLVGDLSPKEAAILEGHLDANPEAKEAKERMARQLTPLINLPAPEVGELALRQLFEKSREEIRKIEPNPVYDLFHILSRPAVGRWVTRAAAVVIAVVVVGAVAMTLRPDSSIVVREVALDGTVRVVRENDLVRTPQGRPLTLRMSEGTVQLDGSSAVRVTRTGDKPQVKVERGRVIVDARNPIAVSTLGHDFNVTSHSVAAFEVDTAYENVQGRGAVIELQRLPIDRVARIGERVFGLKIETGKLPADVRERRVSMYGIGLSRDNFVSSFRNATQRYGVAFNDANGGYELAYQGGAAGNALDSLESVLSVASVQGQVNYTRGNLADLHLKLESGQVNFARIVGNEALPNKRDDMVQHMVVWASRPDLGEHFKLNDSVISLGGTVRVEPTPLPQGTVISGDAVQLPGTNGPRIFKVGAPEYDFPLHGGRMGRVISNSSSGIELEVKGEEKRTYIPLRR